MTDCFALFSEPRRPWVDPDVLRKKFLRICSELHPDRPKGCDSENRLADDKFGELNSAYACLQNPKTRLFHLLTLERGTEPNLICPVSAEVVTLIHTVGRVCRQVDEYLRQRSVNMSPLLRPSSVRDAIEWTDWLIGIRREINTRLGEIDAILKELNMTWESSPPDGSEPRDNSLPCNRLERLHQELSFLTSLSAQVGERLLQLSQ